MSNEILITTETELLVDDSGVDTLVETIVEREIVLDQSVELLVEQVSGEVLVEQTTELLVDQVITHELVEEGPQGPPGPRGPQGAIGLPGASTVGGLGVALDDPQPGDLLALNFGMTWANDRVVDGGNF
jgi:hypothetical protein